VAAILGYLTGEHAPGLQDPVAAIAAAHNLLLSHGYAAQALRDTVRKLSLGTALNLSPVYPASDAEEDRQAAARYDAVTNRLFLEAMILGKYPAEVLEMLGPLFPAMPAEDMQVIAAPLDWVGINYYSRAVVRNDPEYPFVAAAQVQPEGREYSGMWEIYPEGIYDLLVRLERDYHLPNIVITENGVCVPDALDFDGRVRDVRRIAYLRDHLTQVQRAIQDGVPVRGYFVWSLMDNFEWAYGYSKRFGLTYVDFETQKRTVKESGRWYARVIGENGFVA
jgi:beta-glucosidase